MQRKITPACAQALISVCEERASKSRSCIELALRDILGFHQAFCVVAITAGAAYLYKLHKAKVHTDGPRSAPRARNAGEGQ